MPLQLITPPATEPITSADLKAWGRIDIADDDRLVTTLIKAARSFAETKLRRSLITQTWVMTLDAFPGPSMLSIPNAWEPFSIPANAIVLERPPVQSITSIKYLALDGTTKTLTAGTDYVDLTAGGARQDDPVRITPPFGKVWPADVMPQIGAVAVTYVTGWGNTNANIPADILTWITMRAATLYENREEVVVGTRIIVAELPYVDSLIDPWIVEV